MEKGRLVIDESPALGHNDKRRSLQVWEENDEAEDRLGGRRQPGRSAGLRGGDEILTINGEYVADLLDYEALRC